MYTYVARIFITIVWTDYGIQTLQYNAIVYTIIHGIILSSFSKLLEISDLVYITLGVTRALMDF